MRLEVQNGAVATVALSRRNLLSLLHKLDMEGSARTLVTNDVSDDRGLAGILMLRVVAEDDDEHYGGRDHPPGEMHPQTEAFLAAREAV